MLEITIFIIGLIPINLEKSEHELLCEEFVYTNNKMYKKFNCEKLNLQPRNYLNIKN